MDIRVKRVYEAPSPEDGRRILVDRLWPRGLAREQARVDLWLKEVAPSAELRKWFNHEPETWPEFQRRYRDELLKHPAELERLLEVAGRNPVTLLFGTREARFNNAQALKAFLLAKGKPE